LGERSWIHTGRLLLGECLPIALLEGQWQRMEPPSTRVWDTDIG
jgi:hypothetical protein